MSTILIHRGSGGGATTQRQYSCPSSVAVGDAVRVTGSDAVDKTDASGPTTTPGVGFVVSKPSATAAVVQHAGPADVLAGLTPGGRYFLAATPGQITTIPPSGPGQVVQYVGVAVTATVLVVAMGQRVLL